MRMCLRWKMLLIVCCMKNGNWPNEWSLMQKEKERWLENKDWKDRDPSAITVGNLATSGRIAASGTKAKVTQMKRSLEVPRWRWMGLKWGEETAVVQMVIVLVWWLTTCCRRVPLVVWMNGSWFTFVVISCLMSFIGWSNQWKPRLVMDMQLKQQGVALLCWSWHR